VKKRSVSGLWGGRFTHPPSALLRRLNDSFAFDRRLLPEEIAASRAWARALRRAGALGASEERRLTKALEALERDGADAPRRGRQAGAGPEDVHAWVEESLKRRVGPLASRLHAGRSRNDQVATDFRLWLRGALKRGRAETLRLASVLAQRARADAGSPLPGYTHLRQAEPITFGHWCLAYVEMLLRDADRALAALRRSDECPLGSAALGGTPLPVDRHRLARELGFARPTANSLDAVSDRDAAADYHYFGALLLGHLSRMAEDLILYSSDEFGLIELPDALATGSSRMPHKKNPDLLELSRGHAARAIGDLAGLMALLKGLPLAYNKDLQLDKEPAFRLADTLDAVLPGVAALVASMRFDADLARARAGSEQLLVTELADAMAARGVPFREAHEEVGRVVLRAAGSGTRIAEAARGGAITRVDLRAMDLDQALARRRAFGGTAPAQVRRQAAAALRRIARLEEPA
jgi:argininosuccinate lyase